MEKNLTTGSVLKSFFSALFTILFFTDALRYGRLVYYRTV